MELGLTGAYPQNTGLPVLLRAARSTNFTRKKAHMDRQCIFSLIGIIFPAMLMAGCSKESGASYDVSVEASCIDLSGSNFPSPFFTIRVNTGGLPAGTAFRVTFTKRLRAEYIRTWNGGNGISVRSVAADERSAIFETQAAIGSGGELVVYLDQMMTRGDVAGVKLDGKDANNENNAGTVRVVQATAGSANVCRID